MRKKIIGFFSCLSLILIFTSFKNDKQSLPVHATTFSLSPQQRGLRTIVIDAGHGGKDFGAAGKYSYEKNVALAIALKLQATIQKEMPDVNVVMTRTTDVFDAPPVKANKANNAKGDLFICIHCNSVP